MTTELPYTYTDENGAALRVSASSTITVWPGGVNDGEPAAAVWAPTGEDAARLARAILSADGNTGYVITTTEAWDAVNKAHAEHGARSMRERALEVVSDHRNEIDGVFSIDERIRALPLLPDGDTYEVTSGLDHAHVRTYPAPAEDFDAGWAAGHAHAAADAERITALEEAMSQAQAAIRGLESGRVAPRRRPAGTGTPAPYGHPLTEGEDG